ncbi:MAG: hypothetical protein GQ570_00240 [Helicobacteraceae bacterium]|nr:hypothetical protein [Helicobacteraceae bacterium]
MDTILLVVIITATIALITNVILKRFDVPPIIGYIFAGAVIASVVSLDSHGEHILAEVGELGIVFLMFTIGLEIKVQTLIDMRKQVFTFGGLQVSLSMLTFFLISKYIFNLGNNESLVIGAALALSSTAIVLKILNESDEISQAYGKKTLGVLLFQDLAVIPILLMITMMSDSTNELSSMLFNTLVGGVALLIILFIIGKYLLDPILGWVSKTGAHELFILAIMIITIGASYLAHVFGFTYSLGAFIGGMLIAETHYKHQVEADLIPFRDLLLALFFVTVGMQIDAVFLVNNILTILGVGTVIMIIKGLIIFFIISLFAKKTVAVQTALTISQVGEFSFVIFTQAATFNLVDKEFSQLLTLSVIASMLATPFILNNLDSIMSLIFSKREEQILNRAEPLEKIKGHAIVCGYGSFSKLILNKLKESETKHRVIIDDYDMFERALDNSEKAIFGNPAQRAILLQAGLEDASVVIIAVHSPIQIELIAHAVASVRKDIRVIAKVTNKRVLQSVEGINTEAFIDMYEFSSDIMAAQATRLVKG